jgi:hypothetical protein
VNNFAGEQHRAAEPSATSLSAIALVGGGDALSFARHTTRAARTRDAPPRRPSSHLAAMPLRALAALPAMPVAAARPDAAGRRRGVRSSATRASRAPPRRASIVASSGPSSGSSSSSSSPDALFAQLESLLAAASKAGGSSGDRGWRLVEESWVLSPRDGVPSRAVVHFIGGAFVGASPQLTYRLFLEALVSRGDVTVVATPYAIGFEHLRIADEVQFRFDRCVRALGDEIANLPVYGVGHSMGALMHMIIGSRYALPDRAANVMVSFNNKPATDAVPLFAPVVAPGLQSLSPVISGIVDSPLRAPSRAVEAQLRATAPPVVRELLPVLDQLEPVFLEVANGAAEFVPAPEDTKNLIRRYYGVKRNLLLRFRDDSIDETSQLAATLTDSSAISETLDLSVRSLSGDHVRPLRQEAPDVPPEIAEPLAQTGDALSGFADMLGIKPDDSNPLGQLRVGFEAVKEGAMREIAGRGGEASAVAEMHGLADEILRWMDVPGAPPGAAEAKGEEQDKREEVTPTIVPPPPAAA